MITILERKRFSEIRHSL